MEEKVKKLLHKAFQEYPQLFLINLKISPANDIQVIIDGDDGVSVQNCIDISRAIEHQLDREEADFSLEVLSAGATEPLVFNRQYPKNIGRELKVKTTQGNFQGILEEVLQNEIIISWKEREPKPTGKGKITVQKKENISFAEIIEAKVIIKF